jgi:predicted acyl esterase
VYTSSVATGGFTIAGPVEAELYFVTDAISADCHAKLCLVDGDRSWNLAEGIRRLTAAELDCADEMGAVRISISLRAVAAAVGSGQRLRLQIRGGSFPMYDANPQTGAPPAFTRLEDARGALHAIIHEPTRPSLLRFSVDSQHGLAGEQFVFDVQAHARSRPRAPLG